MSDEIKFDPHNYRIHNERNKSLIEKSLKECGAGRSILIDADNEIIAGNGVYEAAQKAKIKIRQVETDGSELIVVKRTDLRSNDNKRKQLAIMDNSTSDSSDFDLPLLQQNFEIDTLNDFGITLPDIDLNLSDGEDANGSNQDPSFNPDAGPQRPLTPDLINKEIDLENFGDDLNTTCPRCGFRFKQDA